MTELIVRLELAKDLARRDGFVATAEALGRVLESEKAYARQHCKSNRNPSLQNFYRLVMHDTESCVRSERRGIYIDHRNCKERA